MYIGLFFTLLTLFSGFQLTLSAQEDDKTRFIHDAGTSVFSFPNSLFYDQELRLPVRSIEIADFRFDSSKTGTLTIPAAEHGTVK